MRARILVPPVVLLVLFGGACAKSSGPTRLTAIRLVSAARKTVAARTSRVAVSVRLDTGSGSPAAFAISGTGLFDYAGRKGTLSITVPDPTGSASSLEMPFEGNLIYEKLPPEATAQMPTAKPWVKIDLAKLRSPLGTNPGPLSGTPGADPSQALQYLLGASSDAARVGADVVRGVSTTHYRLTLDLAKAAQRVPERDRKSYEQAVDALGFRSLPAEAWVDEQGLVRKIVLRVDLSKASLFGKSGLQTTGKVVETVEFFDFGVPVQVTAPPDSDTMDISQLAGAFASPSPYAGSG